MACSFFFAKRSVNFFAALLLDAARMLDMEVSLPAHSCSDKQMRRSYIVCIFSDEDGMHNFYCG